MRAQVKRGIRPLDGGERPVMMSDWSKIERIEAGARRARAEWLHQMVSGAAASLARLVRDHWIEPAKRARRRRADLKALLSLDERTLADIGLRRSDLHAASLGLVPFSQAIKQKTAVHAARVGTVVQMPAKTSSANQDRSLDAAA